METRTNDKTRNNNSINRNLDGNRTVSEPVISTRYVDSDGLVLTKSEVEELLYGRRYR